ncbi:MAG: PAS domain-containing protein [Pseudomonadota bacterium]
MAARRREQRRRSEQSFRYLFESSPLPKWVYDSATLKFLAVNDAAINVYGYSREEFLTMGLEDIRPPEDLARLARTVANPPVRQHSAIGAIATRTVTWLISKASRMR